MPYLPEEQREKLLEHPYPESAGDLNYLITTLMLRSWNKSKRNYEAINAIIGAVEAAKLEFYRRHAAVYEDKKAKLNGDIYDGVL